MPVSILKKQIIAVTGIALSGFIVGHLLGNLLIYAGPEAFNAYAEKLQSLGALLWVVRIILLAAFVVHIITTILLTLENRAARGGRYAVSATKGGTNFVRKTMIYTGLLVLFFFFLHLSDFTFGDKSGPQGLYGLVWESFLRPWRALVYILAVWSVGLHLTHAIQSFFQTLGIQNETTQIWTNRLSIMIGVLVGLGFSSIPIYVNLVNVLSS